MPQPFPIARDRRESDILVGNGGTTYGPFSFAIFDRFDVQALVSRDGGEFRPEAFAAAKTGLDVFSAFTVTFATPLGGTDRFQILGHRLHERSVDVMRGGAISGSGLELELSKAAVVLQELRSAADRNFALSLDFIDRREIILADMDVLRADAAASSSNAEASAVVAGTFRGQAQAARDASAGSAAQAAALLVAATAAWTGVPAGNVTDEGYEGPYDGPTYLNSDEGYE